MLETTGDGAVDSLLADTNGDGCGDTLVLSAHDTCDGQLAAASCAVGSAGVPNSNSMFFRDADGDFAAALIYNAFEPAPGMSPVWRSHARSCPATPPLPPSRPTRSAQRREQRPTHAPRATRRAAGPVGGSGDQHSTPEHAPGTAPARHSREIEPDATRPRAPLSKATRRRARRVRRSLIYDSNSDSEFATDSEDEGGY